MENLMLYHGSSTYGLKMLVPHVSLELKKRLYATEDFKYALVRAGRQLDLIREEYRGIDSPFELCECYPNAFEQMFNCAGTVYILSKEGFRINPDDPDEWITEEDICPVGYTIYRSILTEIKRLADQGEFKLVYYGTPEWDEYWTHVRGGLGGFLKRKLERKQKVIEMSED